MLPGPEYGAIRDPDDIARDSCIDRELDRCIVGGHLQTLRPARGHKRVRLACIAENRFVAGLVRDRDDEIVRRLRAQIGQTDAVQLVQSRLALGQIVRPAGSPAVADLRTGGLIGQKIDRRRHAGHVNLDVQNRRRAEVRRGNRLTPLVGVAEAVVGVQVTDGDALAVLQLKNAVARRHDAVAGEDVAAEYATRDFRFRQGHGLLIAAARFDKHPLLTHAAKIPIRQEDSDAGLLTIVLLIQTNEPSRRNRRTQGLVHVDSAV